MRRKSTNKKHLQDYLIELRQTLVLLNSDLKNYIDSGNGQKLSMVVAVDWSEMFAFATGASPPSVNAPITKLLRPEVIDTKHQISLTVLFERLVASPLLLLPPYVTELHQFVSMVQRHQLAEHTYLPSSNSLKKIESAVNTNVVEEVKGALEEVFKSKRIEYQSALINDEIFQEFIAKLNAEKKSEIIKWLQEDFVELFYLAKFLANQALPCIKHLLGGSSGREKRIGTLKSFDENADLKLFKETPNISHWSNELSNETGGRFTKEGSAFRNDAKALGQLAFLNTCLHARGRQLIFVTRDTHLQKIIRKNKAAFSCLGDRYFRASPNLKIPSILRTWDYFFELGLAWHVEGEHKDLDSARLHVQGRIHNIDERLDQLESRGGITRVWENVESEVARDVQNLKSLLTTDRPWLPVVRKHEAIEDIAVRLFVSYVTDPDKFDHERREIREKVQWQLNALFRQFPVITKKTNVIDGAIEFPFSPLAKQFISKQGKKALRLDSVQIIENSKSIKRVNSLFRNIIENTYPSNLDEIVEVIQYDDFDDLSDGQVYLLLLSHYSIAAFRRISHFLINGLRKRIEAAEPFSTLWTLAKLVDADTRIASKAPSQALNVLQKAREAKLRKRIGVTGVLNRLGFLNACLHFHLDWSEEFGEDLMHFPPTKDEEFSPELFDSFQRLKSYWDTVQSLKIGLSKQLELSLANNLLYAASRLSPIESPSDLMEPVLKKISPAKLLTSYKIKRCLDLLLRVRSKTPAQRDTLGYYFLKLAYWKGWELSKPLVARSTKYLKNGAEQAEDDREKLLLQRHLSLLDYLKENC